MGTERRVSVFVSHHVATHRKAAKRIKELLEARTDKIDVYISEDILCGEKWTKWIVDRIAESKLLIVLLPQCQDQFDWIGQEIKLFSERCPNGRLVVLKPELYPIPDFAKELQVVETSKEELRTRFLKPLYFEGTLTGWPVALNERISDEDLDRDACEIRTAIRGDKSVEEFGETLTVDVDGCDVCSPAGLDAARVHMSEGFGRLLNWTAHDALWKDLSKRAELGVGKGTFWIQEIAEVMREVAAQEMPRVMSSTFRGRGPDSAGKIYRPQLARVESVGDTPVSFQFVFYEVLVPELVRGPDLIGAVYNLLHLVARVRWEVLNPFLVKRYFGNGTLRTPVKMTDVEQQDLIGRVSNSLRAIDLEAERQDTLAKGISAFNGPELELIQQLFDRRATIKDAIADAVKRNDFEQLMQELTRALDLSSQATIILANKYLELAKDDRVKVEHMISASPTKAVVAQ